MFDSKKRGVSDDKVAVIFGHDRKNQKHLQVTCQERISELNLKEALKGKITKKNILCSDSHLSYKA